MKTMIMRLVLMLVIAGASMAVCAQKRLKTVKYKRESYTLEYNSDGSVKGYDIDPAGGKVVDFNGIHFEYDGDQLASITSAGEHFYIKWADGKPNHMDHYRGETRLMYFSDMTYNDQCPDAAIAFAIDFLAGHFADPEGADLIVTFYGLAPYLGTLTNELVGNVKATDGEANDTEIDYYDCNYSYVKDADGYPVEVIVDVKDDYWHSGKTKTYTKQRTIYLEWEGTADIQTIANGQQLIADSPCFNLNGQRVTKPTKGLFLSKGKKWVTCITTWD